MLPDSNSADAAKTSEPAVAPLGKCTDCKYYVPNNASTIKCDAYCSNTENRGKHIHLLLLSLENIATLEPITLSAAIKVFREEVEKVLDFINRYGSPITGSIYGRSCYVNEEENSND